VRKKLIGIIGILMLTIIQLCYAGPKPAGTLLSRQDAIDKLFKGRDLDRIEGVWYSIKWHDEFAIVKNTYGVAGYQYLGLFIHDANCGNKGGDISDLIMNTSSKKLYIGKMADCTKHPLFGIIGRGMNATNYFILDANTIQASSQDRELGSDIYIRLYPSADDIKKMQEKEMVATGSGFFITDSIIVTNNHVISGFSKIHVVFAKSEPTEATVIARDEQNDLALLKVSGFKDVKPLLIGSPREQTEGARVYTVGFPMPDQLGTTPKLGEGIINSTSGAQNDLRMFQISIPVQPGNSGGPLLNSKGQVVGVVTSGMGVNFLFKTGVLPQNVNYAMKSSNIISLVANAPEAINLPQEDRSQDLDAAKIMELAKNAVVFIISAKK
jgi:Trypsin-like serine proteases, typically periplasmic, contain C-terminal PDZ domain